jgi:hypothetical protein
MAAMAVAGVGLMVVCSSSLAAAMMMSGEEETPATGGGGGGPSAPTTTTFFESEIPNDAMVIDVGEITLGQSYNSPKNSTDTTRKYYLIHTSNGNLAWKKQGEGTPAWTMGTSTTAPNTKVYFQGDGNICARGDTTDICMNSAGGARVPTHDSTVPAGQHKLVGTKEGLLYVDHGTGVAGRSVIFTPPTATETYVLPY